MAWSDSTQHRIWKLCREEGGYITFGATSATASVNTFMTKVYTGMLGYRTSGAGAAVWDLPLTSPFTISAGTFTVTRPSTSGGASTFWYWIIGE